MAANKRKEVRVNVFNFTGRLGKEAELRHTAAGKAVCNFDVAVESGYGENKATNWINCTLFEKRAEALRPYLQKSTLVGVSGELTIDQWTDRDGNKRQAVKVRVSEITLLGGKPKAPGQEEKPAPAGKDDLADDIPF